MVYYELYIIYTLRLYIFDVTVVLPVPAPARMSCGDCVCFMASSWRGFRFDGRESNLIGNTFLHSFTFYIDNCELSQLNVRAHLNERLIT
jgi:hypothetical protein